MPETSSQPEPDQTADDAAPQADPAVPPPAPPADPPPPAPPADPPPAAPPADPPPPAPPADPPLAAPPADPPPAPYQTAGAAVAQPGGIVPPSSQPATIPQVMGAAPVGWVPWYRQAGAWVVVGAVVVAAAVVVVMVAALSGGGAALPGGSASAAETLAGGPTAVAAPAAPQGATEDYGIELGQDGVPGGAVADTSIRVDVVSDYICPFCQRFAQEVGPQVDEALAAGEIRLIFHPLGYLDQYSTTEYSSRAARAATTVAALDPAHFGAFDKALWANQPAEGGPGLSDEELAELAREVGVPEDVVGQLAGDEYAKWVAEGTRLVTGSQGFQGTPWVLISNGETTYPWDWSQGDLAAAIAKVAVGEQP
jgi:protein-disulfide isomerase